MRAEIRRLSKVRSYCIRRQRWGWLPVMAAVTTPLATKTVTEAEAEDCALESCAINVTTVTVITYVCPTCKE